MRNKIKHAHNMNATMLQVNPIVDNKCINYGIDSQLCSIHIVNVFDFVAVKSFFHYFAPQWVDFEKISDTCFFYYMYYFISTKEG